MINIFNIYNQFIESKTRNSWFNGNERWWENMYTENQCVIFVPQKILIRHFEKSKPLELVFMFFHLSGFEEWCLPRVTQKVTCFKSYKVNNLLPVTQWLLLQFPLTTCYPVMLPHMLNIFHQHPTHVTSTH